MLDTQVENKLPNQISMFIIERTIFKTNKVLPRSASHRDRETSNAKFILRLP